MGRRLLLPLLVLGLCVAYPAAQATQERIDTDMNARIRKEGMDNSQLMRTMHFLTDVYGPRLTGSPNHENAAKWAVRQMEKWGDQRRAGRSRSDRDGRPRPGGSMKRPAATSSPR